MRPDKLFQSSGIVGIIASSYITGCTPDSAKLPTRVNTNDTGDTSNIVYDSGGLDDTGNDLVSPADQGQLLAISDNGLDFTVYNEAFIKNAGTPDFCYTTSGTPCLTDDNLLIASFVYFPNKGSDSDKGYISLAYIGIEDGDYTVSDISIVQTENLPEANKTADLRPIDPDLHQLSDGSYMLFFSYDDEKARTPRLHYATTEDLNQPFQYGGATEFASPDPEETEDYYIRVLDPALIYIKSENKWHLYVSAEQSIFNPETEETSWPNHHYVTSSDLDPELIESEGATNMNLTGIIDSELRMQGNPFINEEVMRFYGCNGVGDSTSATSTDNGYTWEMDDGVRVEGGGDTAVATLQGKYILMTTYFPDAPDIP
ncbi:hypothetical protein COV16_03400 [Candidatus Woesearchaeota archaeon CG10_big_fil_rev_8_21_14_0_10_34_8]|nr:MAG: hypothetical protein COV16_03400 [Candidatus Woesearchaeota archaeon CG10_big_fil_rev_8_21_14_0_10_34_8]